MNTSFEFINTDYLNLMSDGDEDMKEMMVDMMLEEIPVEMNKMSQLQEAKDWKELREVSHKMKSTLAFIGNDAMTNANAQIEEIAKSASDLEELPRLLAILMDIYPKALDELKTLKAAV